LLQQSVFLIISFQLIFVIITPGNTTLFISRAEILDTQ